MVFQSSSVGNVSRNCDFIYSYLLLYQVYDIYVYQCICCASFLTFTFLIMIIITVTQLV